MTLESGWGVTAAGEECDGVAPIGRANYRISRIVDTALPMASKLANDMISSFDFNLCFDTARIWSMTATAG